MALNTFVYLRDVNNLSDARYAAGMGVDLIGFKLDPNDKKSLKSEEFREISEWIAGVQIVGEFGNANAEEVKLLLPEFPVSYILVTDESQIHSFSLLGQQLILVLDPDLNADYNSTFNNCVDLVDLFLLESSRDSFAGSDKEFLKKYADKYPLLIGYGINKDNSMEIVEDYQLKGIALKGGPEVRPGYKDFDELAEILESLEID